MKKKLFSLAFMAIAASAALMAQTPVQTACGSSDASQACKENSCVAKTCATGTDCASQKCDSKGKKMQCGKKAGKTACADFFAGLNLTEQQKTALKAVPTPGQTMREARKAAAQCDSARLDGKQCKQVCQDVRKNYLAQVKAILTPDQYVQFLENFFTSAPGQGMKKGAKFGQNGNCHRDGHKKDCRQGKRHGEKKNRAVDGANCQQPGQCEKNKK